jgi:hypothetical protein
LGGMQGLSPWLQRERLGRKWKEKRMRDSSGVKREPARNDDCEARLGTLRAVKAGNSREKWGVNKNAGLKPGMINKRESR